jgi:hypothetical protein
MKGVIELIGPRQAMIGVRTEYEDFSVLELLGDYSPEIGDVISGALQNLGDEEVKNITQGEDWDVVIQDILGSKESAWRLVSQW